VATASRSDDSAAAVTDGRGGADMLRSFTIRGEATGIESRWVADAGTAAAAVREWLAAGRGAAASGNWVKM
jgi:hypothetical protein